MIRTVQGSEIVLPNAMITATPVHYIHYLNSQGRVDLAVRVKHGEIRSWSPRRC